MDGTHVKTEDFAYDLPEELIAQTPLKERSASRMMVIHKKSGLIEDRHFNELPSFLCAGDVLVRNNTRVIPARLFGRKEETGAHVELLLLRQKEDDIWECLAGNAKVVKPGTVIVFHDGRIKAVCVAAAERGLRSMKMIYEGIFNEILDELGQVPLPPYIKEKLDDPERYQTVYAKEKGSAAAPTAGLHFTPEIFKQIEACGVEIVDITLHVGIATFRPVEVENIKDHPMHAEFYHISEKAAAALNRAKRENRRIIAVGTTSVRTLEAVCAAYGRFTAGSGDTNLFIYPGYKWQAVDGILTNFHLPRSTLLMMICSFGGYDRVMTAYKHAVEERYRFFSFGDCMFLSDD